jgi:hypothetical protein
MLKFEEFVKAAEEVERIISLPSTTDLTAEIQKSGEIASKETRREFYRHMNSLFLNILLNRLDELDKSAEQRSLEARKIIVNLIAAL